MKRKDHYMKKGKREPQEITFVGRVSEGDVEGETVISTEDDEFYVTQNKVGRQLGKRLGEKVEVTGFLTHDEDNQPAITDSYFASFGDDSDADDEQTDDGYNFNDNYDDDRW